MGMFCVNETCLILILFACSDIDPTTNRKEVMIQIVNSWFVHAVYVSLVW